MDALTALLGSAAIALLAVTAYLTGLWYGPGWGWLVGVLLTGWFVTGTIRAWRRRPRKDSDR
jgi:F420-0:gamma-glutamyl ligase-like protein